MSFEEAKTIFFDEHALFVEDADPSVSEERFVLLGLSSAVRVLVVCHCLRAGADEIRIISARPAIKAEQKQYWERLGR